MNWFTCKLQILNIESILFVFNIFQLGILLQIYFKYFRHFLYYEISENRTFIYFVNFYLMWIVFILVFYVRRDIMYFPSILYPNRCCQLFFCLNRLRAHFLNLKGIEKLFYSQKNTKTNQEFLVRLSTCSCCKNHRRLLHLSNWFLPLIYIFFNLKFIFSL